MPPDSTLPVANIRVYLHDDKIIALERAAKPLGCNVLEHLINWTGKTKLEITFFSLYKDTKHDNNVQNALSPMVHSSQ